MLYFPALKDAASWWKLATFVKEAVLPAAASKEPLPLSASKAANSPSAARAPVDLPAEQDAVGWWKHEVPVKDAAPPPAASKKPSPLSTIRASEAASSPRAEPAPVISSAKQDPAAGYEPASLWAEMMRTVKAVVHGLMVSRVLRGQQTTITIISTAEYMEALSVFWLAVYYFTLACCSCTAHAS